MQNRFEKCLVEQCAPTLAGIKPGSLFRYDGEQGENLQNVILGWNQNLKEKGLCVRLVKERPSGGLIYVYRPAMISEILFHHDVRCFLSDYGYSYGDEIESAFAQLRSRLQSAAEFPHEIGVFLGYPLHDVKGFIANKGRNCTMCGLWKVYHDRPLAERLFAQYDRCRCIYKAMYERGSGAVRLTVAA